METSTVASATDPDPGAPTICRATAPRTQTRAAAPGWRRGRSATPEHLTRITEAAAVAAVEAFYRPRSG